MKHYRRLAQETLTPAVLEKIDHEATRPSNRERSLSTSLAKQPILCPHNPLFLVQLGSTTLWPSCCAVTIFAALAPQGGPAPC